MLSAYILHKEGGEHDYKGLGIVYKPIDRALICRCAEETGAIVTAENHNVIGGLGSAVAEVLVANTPVPMEQVGVQDEFGEVGLMPYLSERFGLTAEVIAQKAEKAVSRKK